MKPKLNHIDRKILSYLDHFINNGWPLRVDKYEAAFIEGCKQLKFIKVKKLNKKQIAKCEIFKTHPEIQRCFQITIEKPIPSKLLSKYYKFLYLEMLEQYDLLYSKIREVINEF